MTAPDAPERVEAVLAAWEATLAEAAATGPYRGVVFDRDESTALVAVLRAVLSLHQPERTHTGEIVCPSCDTLTVPCRTLAALAALDGAS